MMRAPNLRSRRARLLAPAQAIAALLCMAAALTSPALGETILPFDGKTLDNWEGDLAYWSVIDGELVGRSTADHPLTRSTYLVWKGTMPGDFDLRCKVRIQGGNSGIQYRSRRVAGQADMAGFQADLDANDAYTGVLYEGLGRELMSARGEQVEWSPAGKRVVAQFAPDATLRAAIHHGDWNEYRIEARGTRVRHWINGTLMSDVTDGDASRFRANGSMGLQLHQGAPMEVRFKDIQVQPITSAPPPSALIAPPGFTIELLASAQPGEGSWVCITFDPLGRAIISPQSGALMRAAIPGVSRAQDGALWPGKETLVTPLEVGGGPALGGAQGLCFLDGALFVNVSQGGAQNGLWRLRDTDGDGIYDERTRLFAYRNDGGEHGPHGVIVGPDGMLWMTIGNHTQPPDGLVLPEADASGHRAPGSPVDFFAEDIITPRMWDPRGHAVGIHAPGGLVLRIDPVSGASTIFAAGFRNAYDLCFDANGELFTYDSDMEWDIGAPWYRAPRIVHVVQGADYGWRSGSGKWAEWYADSLPPACDTDVSSPTGMLSGAGGAFPAPWRDAIYAADWTYGRILAVQTTPQGASYHAQWQPFITGRPMPVTDMAWGPDGAMYFTTGGRGTQSGLYRVRASASDAAAQSTPAAPDALAASALAASARQARHGLERWQRPLAPAEFDAAFPEIAAGLASSDRFIAAAARIALEHQPVDAWRARVAAMPAPQARAMAALALARRGNDDDAQAACVAALALMNDGAPTEQTLAALRVAQIALLRHAPIAASAPMQAIVSRAIALADASDARIAQAALELTCALGSAEAVAPALEHMERSADRAGAMRYAAMLRTVEAGWTEELRARYWAWLDAANDRAGGMSLGGFLNAIRTDALAHVHRPIAVAAAPESSAPGAQVGAAGAPSAVTPRGAVTPARNAGATMHAWTVDELVLDSAATDGGGSGGSGSGGGASASGKDASSSAARDLARGARLFREATCIQCHRFAGEGAGTGPDLTGVGSRFSRTDLLRAILEPSAFVSDQYRDSAVQTHDGGLFVGRIVADEPAYIEVLTNPLSMDRDRIERSEIASITPVLTSSMPKGLLDARTRAEVLDLLAYLEAGGAAVPVPVAAPAD